MPAQPAAPFESDARYLDAEFALLKTRAARFTAEKQAADAQQDEEQDSALTQRPGRARSRETRCRARELLDAETSSRAEIDARIAVHRAAPGLAPLGLDKLCDEHRLTADERLVLLAAAVPAISQRVSDQILSGLGSFFGALSVADCIAILDPKNVPSDWLRLRRLFRKDATLRKAGLIVLSAPHTKPGPDSLPTQEVRLSMTVFATLIGDADAATEIDETGAES